MRYFKKIEIDDQNLVIAQCKQYIESIDYIYNRKLHATYYPLDFASFAEKCPLIKTSFKRFSINCNFAAAYVSYNNSHNPIHIDNFVHEARINLPIVNCEYSKTYFYTNGEFKLAKNSNTNTSPSILYKITDDFKRVDSVVLNSPTVMLVNKPHQVLMDQQKYPRISLTLGFDIDPIFLLK